MANTAQTRKRARQTVKQRAHNVGLRSTLGQLLRKLNRQLKVEIVKLQKKLLKKMFLL